MPSETLSVLMRELRLLDGDSNRESLIVQKKGGVSVFKMGDKGRFMFIVIEGAVELKSKDRL